MSGSYNANTGQRTTPGSIYTTDGKLGTASSGFQPINSGPPAAPPKISFPPLTAPPVSTYQSAPSSSSSSSLSSYAFGKSTSGRFSSSLGGGGRAHASHTAGAAIASPYGPPPERPRLSVADRLRVAWALTKIAIYVPVFGFFLLLVQGFDEAIEAQLGPLHSAAREMHPIPPPIGWVVLLVTTALVLVGAKPFLRSFRPLLKAIS